MTDIDAKASKGAHLHHKMIRYLWWIGVDPNTVGRRNKHLKAYIAKQVGITLSEVKRESDAQIENLLPRDLPRAPRCAYPPKKPKKYVALKPYVAPKPRLVAAQPKVSGAQIREFYDSWEWKRLSYDIKKQRGRRCECCGATPDHGARIITDHIKPLRFYWDLRLDPKNMQVLCDDCNRGKGSRDETDWREVEVDEF